VVGGIGLGALAAAIGTGSAALSIKSDVDSVCKNKACPPSEKSKVDQGKALALSTDVLIGVGAAAVVVGVILYVVESRHPRSKATSWLGPDGVRF
jgi:hypothetical protein